MSRCTWGAFGVSNMRCVSTMTTRSRPGSTSHDETHIDNEDRVLRSLNASERRTLDGLLRTLLDGLEATEPAGELDAVRE
jgi:hypothetical protein